ncbi:hypothetical protein [Clostridium ganghwense]|uniref:Uncharacterized protein n=1 Tax=Clostridium ganghwense TaxID=312089 RepID=A0ABT4CPK4_9CLOT|nr:hypothetical protein [Clostridium ganghwense]MCY6370990.1 hypothetical protein [Clostridium ganghwense]
MVKKKMSMLLAAVLVASGVAVASPATKAVADTKVAVTYAAPARTMIETDNKMEFALQASTNEAVEYRVWAQNVKTGKWIELTDGYQLSEVGTNPFVPATIADLEAGSYKASIWVRKAGSEAKFDSYAVRNFKIQKDGYFAERANMDELGIKDTYKVGESVTLQGDDQYKLHIYDPSVPVRAEGWMIDDSYEGAEATTYKFEKPGVYLVDVWGKKADSTNKYDGWVLKAVTVTEGQSTELPTATVTVGATMTGFDRYVEVKLDTDKPEDYKVSVLGTELEYVASKGIFNGVVNSTDEEAIKAGAEVKLVAAPKVDVDATVTVGATMTGFDRYVEVKLDTETPQDYKVTVLGTELEYVESKGIFNGVVNSTDEEAIKAGAVVEAK